MNKDLNVLTVETGVFPANPQTEEAAEIKMAETANLAEIEPPPPAAPPSERNYLFGRLKKAMRKRSASIL